MLFITIRKSTRCARQATWNTTARGYTLKEVEYADEDTTLCVATPDDNCSVDDASDPHDCGTKDLGCTYDQKITYKDYMLTLSTDTLFRQVLDRLEKYVQGQYNAKLTKEQNMCRAANSGGIMGRNDMMSTYMWVKLKSKKVPKIYSVNGLKENEFAKSNDLYGSFCRARVTVQSDDPDIQRYLQEGNNSKNWSTAYFAVGDVFTCGSWIPQKDLEQVASFVACQKAKAAGTIDRSTNCCDENVYDRIGLTTGQKWATAAATLGGATLGGVGMDLLQTQTGLGGLLNTTTMKSSTKRVLKQSRDAAEDILEGECKGKTTEACAAGKPCFKVSRSTVDDFSVTSFTFIAHEENKGYVGCEDVASYKTRVENKLNIDEKGENKSNNVWENGLGRGMVDMTGSLALGTVGYLATSKNIKASNRKAFTEAEQAFMNNVGNHIYCFIGADEAGTYGDLIEISID